MVLLAFSLLTLNDIQLNCQKFTVTPDSSAPFILSDITTNTIRLLLFSQHAKVVSYSKIMDRVKTVQGSPGYKDFIFPFYRCTLTKDR